MKNTQTIGREDGSKMEEGPIVQFTSSPEPLENIVDPTPKADMIAKPIVDPEKIVGLDAQRMLGMYEIYAETHNKIRRGDKKIGRNAKELYDMANKFLEYRNAFTTNLNAIEVCLNRINEIQENVQNESMNAVRANYKESPPIPETLRKIIVTSFEKMFDRSNEALAQHEPSKSKSPNLETRAEEIKDMYKELNVTNSISGVMLLTKNMQTNLKWIHNLFIDRELRYPIPHGAQKYVKFMETVADSIRDYAKDNKTIYFWCHGDCGDSYELNDLRDVEKKKNVFWQNMLGQ